MPRKLRIEYPGAMYHVMSRGDRREKIFLDDVDRQDFIKTLAEACQKTNWQVHAYCLMPNHYHLVLETPEPNLVAGMAWLQSTYTIRLNHRHQLFGHVLSGRYKSQLVEGSGNGYLRTACDYVHFNPVRAGMLPGQERLLSYPWSSFGAYMAAPEHRPSWVRVDRLLGEVRGAMEQAGTWDDALVVVSSDHHLRVNAFDHVIERQRVPFMVKLPHQAGGVTVDARCETVITRELILQVLDGRLRTPAEVASWMVAGSARQPAR